MTVIKKDGKNPIVIKTHSEEYLDDKNTSGILGALFNIIVIGIVIFVGVSFFTNPNFRAIIDEILKTFSLK